MLKVVMFWLYYLHYLMASIDGRNMYADCNAINRYSQFLVISDKKSPVHGHESFETEKLQMVVHLCTIYFRSHDNNKLLIFSMPLA